MLEIIVSDKTCQRRWYCISGRVCRRRNIQEPFVGNDEGFLGFDGKE